MLDLQYLTKDRDPSTYTIDPFQKPLRIPSEGETLIGLCRVPAKKTPEETFPVLLQLHGFPGSEQNQDMSQALRRVGFVTVVIHYRGSWASTGTYHFDNLKADVENTVNYLKEHAGEYSIDPERIYLAGHSCGCFAILNYLTGRPENICGAVCVCPSDMETAYLKYREDYEKLLDASDLLRIDSRESLVEEMRQHENAWTYPTLISQVDTSIPILVIGGQDDVVTPRSYNAEPLVRSWVENGGIPEYLVLPAGHTCDTAREELIRIVGQFLARLERNR